MVTLGEPRDNSVLRKGYLAVGYIQQLKVLLGNSSVILHDKNSPKNRTEIFTKTDIVQCSYIAKCNNKYSIGLVAILVAARRLAAAAAAADAKTTTFGSCEKPFFYCPSLLLLRDCVAC